MKDKDKRKNQRIKRTKKQKTKNKKSKCFLYTNCRKFKKKITFPEWIFLKMIVAMPSYISTSGRTV